jgi:cobalt/nickel transport system permease protein
MHIPDGFLSVMVSILFGLVSACVITLALRRAGKELGERQVPLMGVLAAAIFAGQMLNFPVGGGTSGHLLGAALAAVLLGPWPALVVMTSVVAVQALLFQDGGILALGANVFNMAITGVLVSYTVYTLVRKLIKDPRSGTLAGGFAAGWASIFVSSLSAALQLALSGTSPANIAVPAMAVVHTVIGLGEGLITAAALAFLQGARPDLLAGAPQRGKGNAGLLGGGAVLVLVLLVLSPLASTHPDGLMSVAGQNGYLHLAQAALYQVFPYYHLPGVPDPALAVMAGGLVGVLAVFGTVQVLAHLRHQASPAEPRR